MGRVDDLSQQLLVRRVDVQHVHALERDHHITSGHAGHADDAFQHHARFGLDEVSLLGFSQGLDEFGC